jgi:hypothetical protein
VPGKNPNKKMKKEETKFEDGSQRKQMETKRRTKNKTKQNKYLVNIRAPPRLPIVRIVIQDPNQVEKASVRSRITSSKDKQTGQRFGKR